MSISFPPDARIRFGVDRRLGCLQPKRRLLPSFGVHSHVVKSVLNRRYPGKPVLAMCCAAQHSPSVHDVRVVSPAAEPRETRRVPTLPPCTPRQHRHYNKSHQTGFSLLFFDTLQILILILASSYFPSRATRTHRRVYVPSSISSDVRQRIVIPNHARNSQSSLPSRYCRPTDPNL